MRMFDVTYSVTVRVRAETELDAVEKIGLESFGVINDDARIIRAEVETDGIEEVSDA